MPEIGDKAAELLVESGCYLVGNSDDSDSLYTWSSGIRAPVYMNCRVAWAVPPARRRLAQMLSALVREAFGSPDAIVGIESGGVPWAALAAEEFDAPLHVLKRGGGHLDPTKRLAPASLSAGTRVVMVDDLIATQGTLRRSIEVLNEAYDLNPIGAAALVDWNFPNDGDQGVPVRVPIVSMVSAPHVVAAAQRLGRVTSAGAQVLLDFYESPRAFAWTPDRIRSVLR